METVNAKIPIDELEKSSLNLSQTQVTKSVESVGRWSPWLILLIIFIFFAIVFGFSKPNIVVDVNDRGQKQLNWVKLILWSLIIAVILLLLIMLFTGGFSKKTVQTTKTVV